MITRLRRIGVDVIHKAGNLPIERSMRLIFLGQFLSRYKRRLFKIKLPFEKLFPSFSCINHKIFAVPLFLLLYKIDKEKIRLRIIRISFPHQNLENFC